MTPGPAPDDPTDDRTETEAEDRPVRDPDEVEVTVHDAEGPRDVEPPEEAPTGFAGAFAKAQRLAGDPRKARKLLEDATKKAKKDKGALGMVWEELQTLFAFVRDSLTGRYKPTWTALVLAITAIVYFLAPIDVIPDFIIGLGYLDDAAIIGFAIKNIKDQLDHYKAWKAGGEKIGDADASDVGGAAKV